MEKPITYAAYATLGEQHPLSVSTQAGRILERAAYAALRAASDEGATIEALYADIALVDARLIVSASIATNNGEPNLAPINDLLNLIVTTTVEELDAVSSASSEGRKH